MVTATTVTQHLRIEEDEEVSGHRKLQNGIPLKSETKRGKPQPLRMQERVARLRDLTNEEVEEDRKKVALKANRGKETNGVRKLANINIDVY
jgi:hypothetical protein